MHEYFSYHIDPKTPTISFYGTEIKKDEISSVGIKSSTRSTIVEWMAGLFLLFCIYGAFTKGFSSDGVIMVAVAVAAVLVVSNFWGRRVVLTTKNGQTYKSTLLQLPNAQKTVEDISRII